MKRNNKNLKEKMQKFRERREQEQKNFTCQDDHFYWKMQEREKALNARMKRIEERDELVKKTLRKTQKKMKRTASMRHHEVKQKQEKIY